MDILDEKVRYEQEIRILKEKDLEKDQRIIALQDQMEEMKKTVDEMKKIVSVPVVNNVVNNVNNGIINKITFNNYDTPSVAGLKITQDDLLVENIAKKMIEIIYFNKLLPANHTIYLPNIKENRLLLHKGGGWETVCGDAISPALIPIKNAVSGIGSELINSIYKTDDEFTKLYPVVREAIKSFNNTRVDCSNDEVLEIIKNKRELIAETLRSAKVIKN